MSTVLLWEITIDLLHSANVQEPGKFSPNTQTSIAERFLNKSP